ncbi:MAG: nitrogenase molybdenum-iron protein alpha chain, partial [Spirochaetota bacterium]
MSSENTMDSNRFKEHILEKYPPKVLRKRQKQFVVRSEEPDQEIQANIRTVPGIITQRGCCYAGCKGVVLGPTRDIV